MGVTDAADFGVLEAAAQLRSSAISSVELTEACLVRIDERNGGAPSLDGARDAINAWVRLYEDEAREQAREADARRAREGAHTPLLCGIPLGLKDLYGVAGHGLSASSRVLEGNVADRDCTAWARLKAVGMVLVGHTHTHEFAAGGTTDQVGNPNDLNRVVGGSSGGSAAALAAAMVPAALGTDTCGSLRIPSACCGTSTIMASHGVVPIDGIIPLAPSLDHAGPMARTIADCAALLNTLAADGAQVTPLMPPPAFDPLPTGASTGATPLAGLTIAMTDRTELTGLDTLVESSLQEAASACERLGARVVTLKAPWTMSWDDLGAVLMTEVWAYHRHLTDRRDLYRPALQEFMEGAANFTDAQLYFDAQQRRAEGTAAWEDWFAQQRVDLVLEPTLPIVPYGRGPGYDRGHPGGPGDPMIALTSLWDMTGMPVAALPVTWETNVSLIAPRGHEPRLVQAAIDLQTHALGPIGV